MGAVRVATLVALVAMTAVAQQPWPKAAPAASEAEDTDDDSESQNVAAASASTAASGSAKKPAIPGAIAPAFEWAQSDDSLYLNVKVRDSAKMRTFTICTGGDVCSQVAHHRTCTPLQWRKPYLLP